MNAQDKYNYSVGLFHISDKLGDSVQLNAGKSLQMNSKVIITQYTHMNRHCLRQVVSIAIMSET